MRRSMFRWNQTHTECAQWEILTIINVACYQVVSIKTFPNEVCSDVGVALILVQWTIGATTEYEMTLLLGHFFWKYCSLKLHVTFCRTSRVISPKLCHALFSMSRVKSGEFCHGQCHALLFGQKRVTGYFSCHGRFFRKLSRVSKKMSREKKNTDAYHQWDERTEFWRNVGNYHKIPPVHVFL